MGLGGGIGTGARHPRDGPGRSCPWPRPDRGARQRPDLRDRAGALRRGRVLSRRRDGQDGRHPQPRRRADRAGLRRGRRGRRRDPRRDPGAALLGAAPEPAHHPQRHRRAVPDRRAQVGGDRERRRPQGQARGDDRADQLGLFPPPHAGRGRAELRRHRRGSDLAALRDDRGAAQGRGRRGGDLGARKRELGPGARARRSSTSTPPPRTSPIRPSAPGSCGSCAR